MTRQERFGKRLRQLRREKSASEERDVEQEEVAAAIGESQPNVARWEKGRIPKDDQAVRALAAFYGVRFTWLLSGDGPRDAEVEQPISSAESYIPAETSTGRKRREAK